jgi:Flp pilus assembly protein TadG
METRTSPTARRRRTDRGAATVELALLLPLLLVLVFGIIDFGRVFNAQVTLSQAAREGARLAALCNSSTPTTCGSVATRTTAAAPNLSGVSVTTTTTCPVGSTSATDAVVTVSWTITFSTPLAGLVPGFPSSKVLSGTGHMPCQG